MVLLARNSQCAVAWENAWHARFNGQISNEHQISLSSPRVYDWPIEKPVSSFCLVQNLRGGRSQCGTRVYIYKFA